MQNRLAMHDDEPTMEMQLDGALDLQPHPPEEVADVIPDYLRMCQERGVLLVRLVLGKEVDAYQRAVQATLRTMPEVKSFQHAGSAAAGWGATLVTLHPAAKND